MKILIRFCHYWGNFTSFQIELRKQSSIQDLISLICSTLKLHTHETLIKIYKYGYFIRIANDFPIDFYDLDQECIIFVEKIENAENKNNELKIISEQEIMVFDHELPMHKYKSLNSLNIVEKKDFSSKLGLKLEIEYLLNLAKSRSLAEIEFFFKNLDSEKSILINSLGKGGWNSLHFSIFERQNEIAKFFIENGGNVNKVSLDGWTPLILSVYCQNFEIFNFILLQPNVIINQKTSRGTVLHIICKSKNFKFFYEILKYNPDFEIKDSEGKKPMEYNSIYEIQNLYENYMKKIDLKQTNLSLRSKSINKLIAGFVFKTGKKFALNYHQRYLVLNYDEYLLYRYKKKTDYPLNPIEILSLNLVFNVKYTEPPWFYKKNLFYFEIEINNSQKLCFGCKFKKTVNEWIYNLKEALKSCNQNQNLELEKKTPQNNLNYELCEIIDEDKKYSLTEEIIEVPEIKLDPSKINHSYIENINKSILKQENEEIKITKSQTIEKIHLISNYFSPFSNKSKNTEQKNKSKIRFENFELIKRLGHGAYGTVFLVKLKSEPKLYAMKILNKKALLDKKQLRYAVREKNILKLLNHEFLVKLYWSFQTKENLYLIMDYCSGGDLAYHLYKKTKFSENQARYYISMILLSIEYLHKHNIIYRDLKPENILLMDDGYIKLADFGLSKENIKDNEIALSLCGSPAYLAPEIVSKVGAGKAADIYSLGAVLFEMLTGNPPFYCDDIVTLYKNIKDGELTFPNEFSEDTKDILIKLLEKDPSKRIGVINKSDIKNHKFFNEINWDELLNKKLNNFENFASNYFDINSRKSNVKFNDESYNENNFKINRVKDFSFGELLEF